MQNKLVNYRYLLAHKASNYPFIYTYISKLLTGKTWYTGRSTNIVIDGFPRCANTYATFAFDFAQTTPLNIAHHIHKKSQFLVAEKYNIPAILLIRNPIDCIASFLVRQPMYDPETLFKGYHLLYNGLKNSDHFILANFENVLTNYGEIINAVNKKFETKFNIYVKTEENEIKVKQIIHNQDELKGATDYKQRVAYPTPERKSANTEIKNLLLSAKYNYLSNKCKEIYLHLISKHANE